jgi:dienelactone hydrolase
MKVFLAIMILAQLVQAAIKTERVIYKQGSAELEGFLAYDDSLPKGQPAVIIVHDWMGPSEYAEMRAKQMAELGYVAFAADIYGKSLRPKSVDEASKVAGDFRNGDRKLLRARAKAAFDYVSKVQQVDKKKISAAGYCFGGTTVLEMARAGLPLAGVISFHGGLSTPHPKDALKIKSKLLVLHGAIDPYVPAEEVAGFMKEMNDAKVDYQFISYSGAVHAFSQKGAGNDPKMGAAYNEVADKRSFVALREFLKEIN